MSTPLLIDTDPGIDDALALLLAFGSPECVVEAITTVAGNVEVERGTLNARRLVRIARPVPPPIIARGAARPLMRPLVTAGHYHGRDGLGEVLPDEPPTSGDPPTGDQQTGDPPAGDPELAPGIVVETSRRLGRMLTIVALGPLTNIALALARDPQALDGIGRLVVMGGAVEVRGNVTPTAEFNIHVDPEAAARVLEAGLPVELVPLDVTRRVLLTRTALADGLRRAPAALADFVSTVSAFAFRADGGAGGIQLHDPLAVGVALDPSFVTLVPLRIAVGTGGETRREPGAPNCRVALDVDAGRFLDFFLDRLCRASS
jgi:purine nucleosidase